SSQRRGSAARLCDDHAGLLSARCRARVGACVTDSARESALFDAHAAASQSLLDCAPHLNNSRLQLVELAQLRLRQQTTAGAQRCLGVEAVKQFLDFIQRKAGLLGEAKYFDHPNVPLTVPATAAGS